MTDAVQSVSFTVARLVEEASEEIGRLDTLCAVTSADSDGREPPSASSASSALKAVAVTANVPAFATAIRTALIAQLTEGIGGAHATLVGAIADPGRAASLPPDLDRWVATVDAEEARACGGALLTSTRITTMGIAVADTAALDDALRPGGVPRPVWFRVLAAAAAIDDPLPASLVAALLLCAAGTTAQLRYLPFVELDPAERADAVAAWRAGSAEPWARLGLEAAAQSARTLRVGIARAIAAMPAEDAALEPLGRAAITARRALRELRLRYAVSVPALATHLDLSRPAAGDALERLAELGSAIEITGRARDRVFALGTAWTLGQR